MRPKMALNDEDSSTTVSGTKAMTSPAETGSTTPLRDLECDLLKSTNNRPGLRRYLACNLGRAGWVSRGGRQNYLDWPVYTSLYASRPLRLEQSRHHKV